jgi:CRP-like cAMP-binding protein
MTVIHSPKTGGTAAVPPQSDGLQLGEEREPIEVLFPEAKRRERRRRLIVLAAIVVVVGAGGIGYAVSRSKSVPHAAQRTITSRTQQGANGVGPIVTPKTPEALAVDPNGDLYVVDSGRDQILRRLPNGKFQVVAGSGKRGFSGDGGLAVDAAIHLEYDAGVAVSKSGAVYFSDSENDRVREVLPDGIIKTVAGGGSTPLGQGPTPTLDASLASGLGIGGLAIGPDNDVYLALAGGVYRLTPNGMLVRGGWWAVHGGRWQHLR